MISSLALGGAEKIVLDWAKAEVNSGKDVEIAVLYKQEKEWPIPKGVKIFRKHQNANVKFFIKELSVRWKAFNGAISTHLIRDNILKMMWDLDMKTIPVFHNGKQGWKNDPSLWESKNVPYIIGCSDSVSKEIKEECNQIPVLTIKHQASVTSEAVSMENRVKIRKKLNIPEDALLLGAIGAFKWQKNYSKAVEIIAEANKEKPVYLCILGGILNEECKNEFKKLLEKARQLKVHKFIRLPGFVNPSDKFLSAFDGLINTSHHEGFSIATQEALVAGLTVIASNVNGQSEINHPSLKLINNGNKEDYIKEILRLEVRENLVPSPCIRADKIWTIPNSWQRSANSSIETLFITANLNAGGAQRSLVNLAKMCKLNNESFAISVCNGSTNDYFSSELKKNKINAFHVAKKENVFDIAASLFEVITKFNVTKICFWNADPKIKLLLSKFLNQNIDILDVSPGAYAFEELAQTKDFQSSITFSDKNYFENLNHLVFKHSNGDENIPYKPKNVSVIPNGVESLPMNIQPDKLKFLVNGRIAQSKHLKTIINAFNKISLMYQAELIIYGQAENKNKSYLDELLLLAKDNESIIFKGSRSDLSHMSDGYTSIIVLGTNQGCPNAILEAISSGIPVIANDSGGTRELVSEKNGILLNEEVNEEYLLLAMEKMINSKNRFEMGIESKKIAKEYFSMDKMYSRYNEILFMKDRRMNIAI